VEHAFRRAVENSECLGL